MNDSTGREGVDTHATRLGRVVAGVPQKIGDGFTALHFSEEMFDGAMDPLLMVDHFVMMGPTFDPHFHAGISAVTAMFEDSTGRFLNRDTLGANLALEPGDLYWLAAAAGAAHEEKPEEGARTHALQIFVNLPARLKQVPARAFHVNATDVPVIENEKHRVRVVLGRVGTTRGNEETPEDMTMLDGFLPVDGSYRYALPEERQAWIYAVSGDVAVLLDDERRELKAGTATTVVAGAGADIVLESLEASHFVVMAAKPIHEAFVKHGPMVMSTEGDVRRTLARYESGKFGRIIS